jgi:hypothetical protein
MPDGHPDQTADWVPIFQGTYRYLSGSHFPIQIPGNAGQETIRPEGDRGEKGVKNLEIRLRCICQWEK